MDRATEQVIQTSIARFTQNSKTCTRLYKYLTEDGGENILYHRIVNEIEKSSSAAPVTKDLLTAIIIRQLGMASAVYCKGD